jgi:hypothetical protein
MAETITADKSGTDSAAGVKLDWDALAKSLRIGSAEEAKKRAYEIAAFVARVENDNNSELIWKRDGKKTALTLKR